MCRGLKNKITLLKIYLINLKLSMLRRFSQIIFKIIAIQLVKFLKNRKFKNKLRLMKELN